MEVDIQFHVDQFMKRAEETLDWEDYEKAVTHSTNTAQQEKRRKQMREEFKPAYIKKEKVMRI